MRARHTMSATRTVGVPSPLAREGQGEGSLQPCATRKDMGRPRSSILPHKGEGMRRLTNGFLNRNLASALALSLATALAGCGGAQYASSDPAFPGDFAERHPIVLVSAPTTVDVFPVGGAIDPRAVANLRAFAERYRAFGSGGIVILTPATARPDPLAVASIRRTLAAAGASGRIGVSSYLPSARDTSPPIRVAFMGLKAKVADSVREMAGRSRLGLVVRGLEERALRQFRLRVAGGAGRAGRRSARFRPAARARAPPTSSCGCGPSRTSARARIPARTGRPTSSRSVGAAPRTAARAARHESRGRSTRRRPDRTGAPRLDPGVLRDGRGLGLRRGGLRGPADGQGAGEAEHGRRSGRPRGLSQRPDAQRHRARSAERPRPPGRAARRTRPILRRRERKSSSSDAPTTSCSIVSSIARGVSEYLVPPFASSTSCKRSRSCSARPGRSRSAASSPSSAPRAASAPRRSRTISPGRSPRSTDMATIIADFDLAFGTAGLDYNQDPPQGVAEAVFAPERVDAMLVDRLLSKCGDNLSLLAAPATLDRTLDFSEAAFDSLIDAMRASTPWIVLDVPHVWTAWARRTLVAADEVDRRRRSRPRQPAQRQEHPRRAQGRSAARPSAASGRSTASACCARPEIAVADFAKTVEVQPVVAIPHDAKLFGSAANNGQMIAEIEPKGKVARDVRRACAGGRGRGRAPRSKRGLLDPFDDGSGVDARE